MYTAEPKILVSTREEITNKIKLLKNNESPGEYQIIAELLKYGGKQMVDDIHMMIGKIWKTQTMLEE